MKKFVVTRYTGLGASDTEDILIEADDFRVATSGALIFTRTERASDKEDGEEYWYTTSYGTHAWAEGEWLAVTIAVSAELEDGAPGVVKQANPLDY